MRKHLKQATEHLRYLENMLDQIQNVSILSPRDPERIFKFSEMVGVQDLGDDAD